MDTAHSLKNNFSTVLLLWHVELDDQQRLIRAHTRVAAEEFHVVGGCVI
jgi:hypothetical protein